MAKKHSNSRGEALARRLQQGQQQAERALRPGARERPVLQGVTMQGCYTKPMANVLKDVQSLLVESKSIYRYGNSVVLRMGEGENQRLIPLKTDNSVEEHAADVLENVFICEIPGREEDLSTQYAPPKKLVANVLHDQPTLDALPEVKFFASRPVFDSDFRFCGPGWHPEAGILVHGPEIEVKEPGPLISAERAIDRLPPQLKLLLQDFCFRSDADLANALAAIFTGLLGNHFMASSKPVVLVDGNQPAVGKSLLVRVIGVLLDGRDLDLISYTPRDEELQKQICSTLMQQQSVLLIDNAKTKAGSAIDSPTVEAQAMAPVISLRKLGASANYRRPNDVLWAFTMNDTRTSPDLVSRGLPIQLHFEGNPQERELVHKDLVRYALEKRLWILAELVEMVNRWRQQGRPFGKTKHRCSYWAEIIGGIMECNGFPEFLTNLTETTGQFNVVLDEVSRLVESLHRYHDRLLTPRALGSADKVADGLTAQEWIPLFENAKLPSFYSGNGSEGTSIKSKATKIGSFFSPNVGREFEFQDGSRTGVAKLLAREGPARKKYYSFEIRWEESGLPAAEGVQATIPPDVPKPTLIERATKSQKELVYQRTTPVLQERGPQSGNGEAGG